MNTLLPLLLYLLQQTNSPSGAQLLRLSAHPVATPPEAVWNLRHLPNYPPLAAAMDWDLTTPIEEKVDLEPSRIRALVTPTLWGPTTTNRLAAQIAFTQKWLALWKATETEEHVLKRLSVDAPEAAEHFASQLDKNPKNRPFTAWFHWKQLRQNKEYSAANNLAQQFQIKTNLAWSHTTPSAWLIPTLDWPCLDRVERYIWSTEQHRWAITLIPGRENTTPITLSQWTKPTTTYQRAFQYGPSWQTHYQYHSGQLTCTTTYCEANSYLAGQITPDGYQETVQLVDMPPTSTRKNLFHTELSIATQPKIASLSQP